MRLKGKVALVTGGSRGIGRAIAKRFAAEGARVAIVYQRSRESADELIGEITKAGGEALAIQADVRSAEAADKAVQEVLEKWERIDILVNNAGVVRDTLFVSMEPSEWQEVIETNLGGAFNFSHAVTRQMMLQRSGKIINMSSVAAEHGGRGQVNYAASKGGINSLTRALACELASRKITVNAIAPGMIETEMSEAVRTLAGDKILPMIPLKRYGQPEDIAGVALFLASAESDYMTGQVLTVDGGLGLGGRG